MSCPARSHRGRSITWRAAGVALPRYTGALRASPTLPFRRPLPSRAPCSWRNAWTAASLRAVSESGEMATTAFTRAGSCSTACSVNAPPNEMAKTMTRCLVSLCSHCSTVRTSSTCCCNETLLASRRDAFRSPVDPSTPPGNRSPGAAALEFRHLVQQGKTRPGLHDQQRGEVGACRAQADLLGGPVDGQGDRLVDCSHGSGTPGRAVGCPTGRFPDTGTHPVPTR